MIHASFFFVLIDSRNSDLIDKSYPLMSETCLSLFNVEVSVTSSAGLHAEKNLHPKSFAQFLMNSTYRL